MADILFGDYNPSGKLPITYPRYANTIMPYDHTKADRRDGGFGFEGFNPQYPFGFGLSYTQFSYSNLTISGDTIGGSEPLSVSVKVSNDGLLKGQEVVQLYTSDLVASIVPAVKQLKRFEKITLAPGEIKTVNFSIKASDLAFVNRENQWVTETGDFILSIDTLTARFYFQNTTDEPLGLNVDKPTNNRKKSKQ